MVRKKLLGQAALAALIGLAAVPLGANEAQAIPVLPGSPDQVIKILCTSTEPCGFSQGTTADGSKFTAAPNPSQPSTGTGVFQPFMRTQTSTGGCGAFGCITIGGKKVSTETGFNTDNTTTTTMNFDTKPGLWTRSVTMSEFEILPGGFILLSLDANESGSATSEANEIVITNLQIFIGPNLANPEASHTGINNTGYFGTQYDADNNQNDNNLLGQAWRWSLDSAANGDVDVVLQSSICNTPGQCGSGHGDLNLFVPVSLLGSFLPTDNFVLYTEYLYPSAGFEEWKFEDAPFEVPEPGTLGLFGVGLAGLWSMRRRRRA